MNPNYTTDGPWSSDSEFVSSPDGFIAQLVERETPRETEANGHLIASAPELLSALNRLIQSLPEDSNEYPDSAAARQVFDSIAFARAAISKATGGAL